MYFLCTLLHSTIGGGIPWTGHTSFTSSPVLATTDTISSSFTGGPLDGLLGNFPRDIWVKVHSRRSRNMLIHFWQLTKAMSFAFKFNLYCIIICKVLNHQTFPSILSSCTSCTLSNCWALTDSLMEEGDSAPVLVVPSGPRNLFVTPRITFIYSNYWILSRNVD